eukprot:15455016-Alexandrium_andersonii.AAC.1
MVTNAQAEFYHGWAQLATIQTIQPSMQLPLDILRMQPPRSQRPEGLHSLGSSAVPAEGSCHTVRWGYAGGPCANERQELIHGLAVGQALQPRPLCRGVPNP